MNSNITWCEVIGCRGRAEWVRMTNFDADQEDCLCLACWTKLYAQKSEQAAFYSPCVSEIMPAQNLDLTSTPDPEFSCMMAVFSSAKTVSLKAIGAVA